MVFFSLEMQKTLVQTKVYYQLCYSLSIYLSFYLSIDLSISSWKETSHKLSKVAVPETSFPNVYIIDKTSFGECFLFHVITIRHYFLSKFFVTPSFGETSMLLRSLKQAFWKKSQVTSIVSTITCSTANIKGPQQRFYFLHLLIAFFYSFSLWMFHIFL